MFYVLKNETKHTSTPIGQTRQTKLPEGLAGYWGAETVAYTLREYVPCAGTSEHACTDGPFSGTGCEVRPLWLRAWRPLMLETRHEHTASMQSKLSKGIAPIHANNARMGAPSKGTEPIQCSSRAGSRQRPFPYSIPLRA